MGLHTSVKAQINVRRPTLSVETDAVHEENEATNFSFVDMNPTIPAALSVLRRTMSVASATSYGHSSCDGIIPCLPLLSSAAKGKASYGTRTKSESPPPRGLNSTSKVGLKIYEFTELERATRSFHPKHMVDGGGLGRVFKGWVKENSLTAAEPARSSRVIAVKRIEKESFESNMDWLKEVDYLGKLHHQNLVKLIGYCLEDDHQLLVYEFVPLGNLHNYLFSGTSGIRKLSWNFRMKIALGAATGLEFLHSCKAKEKYGNFSTSKILLDRNYDVKLCGYGLQRHKRVEVTPRYDDRIMGPAVNAYTAPECRIHLKEFLTTASDVYSFGIVLLEILSGRRALDHIPPGETVLVTAVNKQVHHIFDTSTIGEYPKRGARKALSLITLCLQAKAEFRPNMKEVVAVLMDLKQRRYPNRTLSHPPRQFKHLPRTVSENYQ